MLSQTHQNLNQQAPKILYGDGSTVFGYWMRETVQVADVSVTNFQMEAATNVTNTTSDEDGIMGLGISPTNAELTFWDVLVKSGQINSPVFSYYISGSETSGAITFGGIDTNRFAGPLNWVKIIPSSPPQITPAQYLYWKLPMDALFVGNNQIQIPPNRMFPIVDTGTSLGIFPEAIAKAVNDALGLQPLRIGDDSVTFRGFSCPSGQIPNTNLPNLVMNFGSTQLSFTPKEYLFVQTDDLNRLVCISGIIGSKDSTFILGNILLRRYYTVFDQYSKAIGFAVANRSPRISPQFVAGSFMNSPMGTSPFV
jgi:hypothetical protein